MARVVSIVYTPRQQAGRPQDRYLRVPVDRALLVENSGIDGDAKGRPGERQINVMVAEVLETLSAEGFKTGPGEMGEQLVIAGIAATALSSGVRLRIGNAIIEVTVPRTGCARFEAIQGKSKLSVEGRLGVLARVVADGEVCIGDAVEVLASSD